VATKLADLREEWVVVGGLVPSLLIEQDGLDAQDRHVGTLDVDLGLHLAVLKEGTYREVSGRLREAGFSPDSTEGGKTTRQRWVHPSGGGITVEFLIPPVSEDQRGGSLQDLEGDFAAIVVPGLGLAFLDRQLVTLSGQTLTGESATRDLYVCGPGAYLVLKALALGNRGFNKDAYDLYYLLQHYPEGLQAIADALWPFRSDPAVEQAITFLRRDFAGIDGIGPMRAAEFLGLSDDEGFRGHVLGLVDGLLRLLG
jgi:hypothetical protein